MNTSYITINEAAVDDSKIEAAGTLLKEGRLVAFPTETVYGLGANALDEEAAAKIYSAKGRPSDNPLIVHIADWDALGLIVKEIPPQARLLADRFWPGPLTMIFQKNERVPYGTTGGLETVAVRMPSNRIAQKLIRAGGGYVAAPSANTSGRPSPTQASHVRDDLDGKIDMIIDGGPVSIGLESTIVDLSEGVPTILRPGYITKEMLEEVLGHVEVDQAIIRSDSDIVPKAPGMKYKHYAPKADLVIVEGKSSMVVAKINELVQMKQEHGLRAGVICTEESFPSYEGGVVRTVGSRQDEESIAKNLFAVLREFDDLEVDCIYSESFEAPGLGQAIMNRLLKAAAHQVVKIDHKGVSKLNRIIFVSNSGTISGPMAEGLAKEKLKGKEIDVISRGLVVLFPEPINQKAEAVMISNGIRMDGYRSAQLTKEDLGDACLILTRTEKQKETVLEAYPEQKQVYTLCEFTGEEDTPNPYGGELADYGRCFEQIERMVDRMIERLSMERSI